MANAVLDGIDGFMLGAETLRGCYPLECVRTVLSIAHQAELVFDHAHHFELLMQAAMQARSRATPVSTLGGHMTWYASICGFGLPVQVAMRVSACTTMTR